MIKSSNAFQHLLFSLYDQLNAGAKPSKADCIFVFAGKPERKTYGLKLYRDGYASRIIFSVGRFEWRRFLQVGLEDYGGLLDLVEATPYFQRHFFVHMTSTGTSAFGIPKRQFGTLSEAMALSEFIERLQIKKLMIISSGFHLRRAVKAVKNCCANPEVELIPVQVPNELASETRENWWKTYRGFSLILSEYLKYFLYRPLIIPVYSLYQKNKKAHPRTI